MEAHMVDFRLYPEADVIGLEAFTDRAQEHLETAILSTFPNWTRLSPSRVAVPRTMIDPILTSIRRNEMTFVVDRFEAALHNRRTFTPEEWKAINDRHARN
jgi:hypothetical protein